SWLDLDVPVFGPPEEPPPLPGPPVAAPPPLVLEPAAPASDAGPCFVYGITAHNAGARPLAGTTAEHELPPGVVLVSAEPTPRVVGRTLTWDLGPLGPGERRAVKVRARAEAPGSVAAEALAGFRTSYTLATPLTRPRLTLALGLPATVLTGKEAF